MTHLIQKLIKGKPPNITFRKDGFLPLLPTRQSGIIEAHFHLINKGLCGIDIQWSHG